MKPYDKAIFLVSVLVSWATAGMLSATAGPLCSDTASLQPRIVTLKDKAESLESEYGVRFVYSSDIDLGRPYTGGRPGAAENDVVSGSLEAALDRVFRGTGISWKRRGKYIVLEQEPPEEVRDRIATDPSMGQSGERNDTIMESRITADHYVRERNRTQTGMTRIEGKKFNSGFAFMSSPDLIKTIQSLSGVAAGTELMSGLYVHGGTGTDNLFLLDGVPLYQVSHFAGLFSAFNTDVVESADFYKSGFPARYGGRLSSVVDVRTKDGDFEEYHGLFSIGLIDGRLQYEGPVVKGKTSFNVAVRRSWMDVLMIPGCRIINDIRKGEPEFDIRYSFYDANGRITHRFSGDNRLSFNFYTGRDGFRIENRKDSEIQDTDAPALYDRTSSRFVWGNLAASLDWDFRFSDRMCTGVTVYYTRSNGKTRYNAENRLSGTVMTGRVEDNASVVRDLGLKAVFEDDADRENYYGAIVQSYVYYVRKYDLAQEDFPMEDYYSFPYVFSDEHQDMSSEKPELRVRYSGGNRLNENYRDPEMILFNDRTFNGKKAELEFRMNYTSDYYYTLQTGTLECRSRYRLILFSISSEFYNNVKAWYNRYYGSSYIDFGIFPPSFVYTNIRGGLGLFGAVNVSVSDWMDNPGELKEAGPLMGSV